MKCSMHLFIHSQNSAVASFQFVISPNTFPDMWLLIHAMINLETWKGAPDAHLANTETNAFMKT